MEVLVHDTVKTLNTSQFVPFQMVNFMLQEYHLSWGWGWGSLNPSEPRTFTFETL